MVMFKESSKHSKLSTKLSTIWQINDYLSKKIDNRLIVDIIDTRGHPAFYNPGQKENSLICTCNSNKGPILCLTFP